MSKSKVSVAGNGMKNLSKNYLQTSSEKLSKGTGKNDAKLQKVIVFYGGISSEHEVSKMSFENLSSYFKDLENFEFICVLIEKNGEWVLRNLEGSEISKNQENLAVHRENKYLEKSEKTGEILNKEKFIKKNLNNIWFLNCLHGKGGEDGNLRKFLEKNGVYKITGCSSDVLKTTFDKLKTQEIVEKIGVRVPKSVLVKSKNIDLKDELSGEKDGKIGVHCFVKNEILKIQKTLGDFPYFIKPNADGSSIGLNIIRNETELKNFLKTKKNTDFLIQEKIEGVEVTVGFDQDFPNLPIMEVDNGGQIFDYNSKYFSKKTKEILFAPSVDEKTQQILQENTKKINECLRTSGTTRTDWIILKSGEPVFLEINTYPGLTKNSFIPKMLAANGVDMKNYLGNVLNQFIK